MSGVNKRNLLSNVAKKIKIINSTHGRLKVTITFSDAVQLLYNNFDSNFKSSVLFYSTVTAFRDFQVLIDTDNRKIMWKKYQKFWIMLRSETLYMVV